MAKSIRMIIPPKTIDQAPEKRLSHVFSGGCRREETGEFWRLWGYQVSDDNIVRGDFSRYVWMFFVSYESNVADISKTSQLAESRMLFVRKCGLPIGR